MREDFTDYDIKPTGFINYLRYYGSHFNKKLCEFAIRHLDNKDYTKDRLDTLLKLNNIELENLDMYDHVYVANYLKSILFGSGISDEKHLLLGIKSIFSKESELIFNRFIADMAKKGIPIEWEDMI